MDARAEKLAGHLLAAHTELMTYVQVLLTPVAGGRALSQPRMERAGYTGSFGFSRAGAL